MNYKKINEVLSDLNFYNLNRKYTKVSEQKSADYGQELSQGDVSTNTIVFNVGMDNIYLKVVVENDSYGENETLSSVQFVSPVTKQVTDFEPITE